MKLVTAAQMQTIDRRTIDAGLVPALDLMENAGVRAAREAASMLPTLRGARVEVLCGKGNNGGDGFVVARELAQQGARVRVHMTHAASALSPDAATNFARLEPLGIECAVLPESLHEDAGLSWQLGEAALCVDALLGTGAERKLAGRLAALVDCINRCARSVLAVDVPTGIDATSGALLGCAVRAQCTVTFGLPKLGLVLYPGRAYVGRLIVADIGFPAAIVDAVETPWSWVGPRTASRLLPPLDPTAHKYARGTVLVVAGSRSYPGAAALCAEAALRSGAGMVHLVSVQSNRTILESRLREVLFHAAPETAAGTCAPGTLDLLAELTPRADAVAVGPGLGTAPETLDWLRDYLAGLEKPAVLDADGLRALPSAPHPAARVLTPHTGELGRLLDCTSADVRADRATSAARAAAERGAVVLAKGAPTYVVDPTGHRWVNGSGNVGLATGGTGDVLTGIVGALLAQGLGAVDAARLGAYVHGAAADILSARTSPRSLIAGDLLPTLGTALRNLEKRQ